MWDILNSIIFDFFLYLVKVQSNYLYPNVQLPVTYPATAPEVAIPELDGKTAKMYRFAPHVYSFDYFFYHIYIYIFIMYLNCSKTIFCHRGGKICLTDHFKPLWARNVPKFGLAHLMALGVSYVACLTSNVFCHSFPKIGASTLMRFKLIANLCSFLSLDHGLLLRFQTSLQKA